MKPSTDDLIEATFKEAKRDGIHAKLIKAKVTYFDEIPEPTPILSIVVNGKKHSFATLGNFSVIQGKPKAGKSFVLLPIVAAYLCPNNLFLERFEAINTPSQKIVYFDTEQGRNRTKRIINRLIKIILRDTDISEQRAIEIIHDNLEIFSLREYNTTERFKMIEEGMNTFNAHLVVIDGIIDIVTKNDEEEAIRITDLFLKWTEQKQLHIITNIHENKEGNNSRGVVGAKLDAKAETVFRMQRDGKQFEFIAFHTRDEEPPKITFIIEEELPTITETFKTNVGRPKKKKVTELTTDNKIEILRCIYKNSKKIEFEPRNISYWLKKSYEFLGYDALGDNAAKELLANLKGEFYLDQPILNKNYFLSEKWKDEFGYWEDRIFKIGTVVSLKEGGENMKITHQIEENIFTCKWIEKGESYSQNFNRKDLKFIQ